MKNKKIQAIFQMSNLLIAIIAFSFVLSLANVGVVDGEVVSVDKMGNVLGGSYKGYNIKDWSGLPGTGSYPSVAFPDGRVMTKGKTILPKNWLSNLNNPAGGSIEKVPTKAGSTLSGVFVKHKIGGKEGAGIWTGFGGVWDSILSGAQWAATAYTAGHIAGSMLGFEEATTSALSNAMAAGFGVGRLLAVGGQQGGILSAGEGGFFSSGGGGSFLFTNEGALAPWVPWAGGIAVALIVFELTYSEQSQKIVTFECYPWEAPSGGNNCEDCMKEGEGVCTEYRCKSLGQACELLNAGTGEEACAWVNKNDVKSPVMQPWKEVLTKEHKYNPDSAVRPPDRGVKIIYEQAADGCVKAFSPLEFGIVTNEPAQCKVDYERKDKFDDMSYYMGGSNIYKYNHSQILRLPSPDHITDDAGPEIKADGNYNLYARCKDANGNANDDMFVFSFCVEKGPDVTAPKIEGTSIKNEMPIQYELEKTEIEVYVNEPAECRWSRVDRSYDNMENAMSCSQHVWEMNNMMLYKCKAELDGLKDREDNIFYFRCKDQPWLGDSSDRNTNTESYKFSLKGTQPLDIVGIKPAENSVIRGTSGLAVVWLELETDNGYNFGDSWCYYSSTGEEDSWIQMKETGTNKHKQRLDLPEGDYKYYFKCVDLGGNADTADTKFEAEIDTEAPKVVRVYKDGGKLKIITDEKSNCAYQTNEGKECNFVLNEASQMPNANSTEHFAEWLTDKTYYIKCGDEIGKQPLPSECSIVVKPQS